jgi:hypothetical protein
MRRRQARPVQERKPPFCVGIDIGKTVHHAYVVTTNLLRYCID